MSDSSQSPADRQLPRWAWAGAALVFALALQGVRPLWDPDEGRYAVVALRMLRTGDWLTPTLHHEVVHFAKPPLVYWLMAASCKLLGASEWSLRLPSALAFAATVLLVARIASRLIPGREVRAGVVQATSLLPFIAASVVTTDSVLAFWETLAIAAWVDLRWNRGGRLARWIFWLALAGGFLTKGPVGLLALATVLAAAGWERLRGRSHDPAVRLVSPGPILVATAVAVSWFVFESSHHPHLIDYWLGAEVAGRVTTAEFGRNPGLRGLAVAYLPLVLLGMLPWSIVAWVRRRSRRRARLDPAARTLLVCWLVVPGSVFVLAQSRLPLYLLPLAPAASLWIASVLPGGFGRREAGLVAAWAVALLGLRGASTLIPEAGDGRRFAERFSLIVPAGVGELAFVDHRPHYSLAYYLDAEVEWVRLFAPAEEGEPSYTPLYETLRDELAEPERGRYFLVERAKTEIFERAVAAYGYETKSLGIVERFTVYSDPRRRR